MVKTVLGRIKSRAVFSTIPRIGSTRSSHHYHVYVSSFVPYPDRNFSADWKSFPCEAIGQVRRVQASLLTAGDGHAAFFHHILAQKRGQFSLRSVGLPWDTLLLVFIMTCLIVKLLGGKHRVRFFSFNSLISVSDMSAPKPPKCPPNFMWRAREWSYSV